MKGGLRIRIGPSFLGLAVMLGWAVRSQGASLEMAYSSLESIIVRRVMTESGRFYMEGDPSSTCRYAFVQQPRVDARDGRLRITVLFAGRAGAEVAGNCVGPGDNFDVLVSGVPVFSNGELSLSSLRVEAPESHVFRLFRPLIESRLREKLRYPVAAALDYLAGVMTSYGNGKVTFETVGVDSIVLGEQALQVRFDFGVSLKP